MDNIIRWKDIVCQTHVWQVKSDLIYDLVLVGINNSRSKAGNSFLVRGKVLYGM